MSLVDSNIPLPNLLQEYREGNEEDDIGSIEDILSTTKQLRNSLIDSLSQDYAWYRPNCNKLHQLRANFAFLESQISALNKKARNEVIIFF